MHLHINALTRAAVSSNFSSLCFQEQIYTIPKFMNLEIFHGNVYRTDPLTTIVSFRLLCYLSARWSLFSHWSLFSRDQLWREKKKNLRDKNKPRGGGKCTRRYEREETLRLSWECFGLFMIHSGKFHVFSLGMLWVAALACLVRNESDDHNDGWVSKVWTT